MDIRNTYDIYAPNLKLLALLKEQLEDAKEREKEITTEKQQLMVMLKTEQEKTKILIRIL
ncbi:MAG: hypothetical protein OXI43_02885 [Candidatus Poribacteria bacterium]|nr:hypothetical protein [Candidatus Poribacteria bacterium]